MMIWNRVGFFGGGLTALLALAGCGPGSPAKAAQQEPMAQTARVSASDPIEAGRYLVLVGGCNNCHTPGYPQSGGRVPESSWLMGKSVGHRGPWGTTYASNLRLTAADMSEDAWVEMLNTRTGAPPMPWTSVRAMHDDDKRAIHRYIRSLGGGGEPAPAALPPGVEPETPYEDMRTVPPKAG